MYRTNHYIRSVFLAAAIATIAAPAILVEANRVEAEVGDTKTEILQQPGLFQVQAILQIVVALSGGHVGFEAPVQ